MKKILIISLLALSGCSKKPENCSEAIYKIPGNIDFMGLDTSKLHTVIITRYKPDGTFSVLTGIDTLNNQNVYEDSNGHIYRSTDRSEFASIDKTSDVGIYFPMIPKHFFIQAVYSTDTVETWTEEHCRGRTFVAAPSVLMANGVAISGTSGSRDYFIY